MISPALREGQTSVTVYFPNAIWYDYFTKEGVRSFGDVFQQLDCPLDCLPIHVRGGAILPYQVQ